MHSQGKKIGKRNKDSIEAHKAIDYLVHKNFPFLKGAAAVMIPQPGYANTQKYIKDAGEYKKHLESMKPKKVIKLAEEEKIKAEQLEQCKEDDRIKNLPHNQPGANIDSGFWKKVPFINCLEEGPILAVGIDARYYQWKNFEKYYGYDPKVTQIYNNRILISRAIEFDNFPSKAKPKEFIELAKRLGIDFSAASEFERGVMELDELTDVNVQREDSETVLQNKCEPLKGKPNKRKEKIKKLYPKFIEHANANIERDLGNKKAFADELFKYGAANNVWSNADFAVTRLERDLSDLGWETHIKPLLKLKI